MHAFKVREQRASISIYGDRHKSTEESDQSTESLHWL